MDVQARDIILLKGKKPDTFYFYLVDFFDPEAQYFSAYRIHLGGKYYHNRDYRVPKEYLKSDKVENNGGYINLFTGRACFDKKHIIEVVGRLPQELYVDFLAKYIVIATGGWYTENGTYKIGDTKVPLEGIVFNFSSVAAMAALKKKQDAEKKAEKAKKKENKPKPNLQPKKQPEQKHINKPKDRVRPGAVFGPKKKERKAYTPPQKPVNTPEVEVLTPLDKLADSPGVVKDLNIEARIRNGVFEVGGVDYNTNREDAKEPSNTITATTTIKSEDIKPPEPVKPPAPVPVPNSFAEPEYRQMDYSKIDMTVVKRRYNACKTRNDRLDELFKMLEDAQGCIPVGDVYRYIFMDYKGSPKMRKPNTKAVMLTRGELETMADAKTFEDVEGMGFYRYGSEGSVTELASKQSYFDLMEKCKALCEGKAALLS